MMHCRMPLLAFLLVVLAAPATEAIPCPGGGAKLKIVINNPTTTTGQKVIITGSVVDAQATCVGESDTYATTVTLASTGDNTFIIPAGGGLNTGIWMHHISIGDQFQHQRTAVMFTSDSSKYATIKWQYHPTVIQVNKNGDATGACSGASCTLRQALDFANSLPVSTNPAVLVQLMISPGAMEQTSDLDVGSTGSSKIITIDGTDATGNPWIVGDALAAAQGNQSPFTHAIDLYNTTKFKILGNNVTVRGVAIINTVTTGSPAKTLIESTGTNTRIEAVRLDGGAAGTCGSCTLLNVALMDLSSGAQVVNVEGRAAFSNGVSVTNSGANTQIRDSWFHHNYGSGVLGSGAVLERNTIELTGRRLSDNAVMTTDGVGVRGDAASEFHTIRNLIRNSTSFGIEAVSTSLGLDFAHDAVCGNGDIGISVFGSLATPAVTGTGLGTVYNATNGIDFDGDFLTGKIQINSNNAFTANGDCGFSNLSNITAVADNNQWRNATTTCSDSAGVDYCSGGGFGPIVCPSIQNYTDKQVTLDPTPAFPMNAIIKGQTLRVVGAGFNAIDGNPPAGTLCALGSDDVSSTNCCRKKTKANVCATTGTPPNPPANGSNCAAVLDATNTWRRLSVTSVTPTTVVTEAPNPALVCVGEGYTQTLRVVKQGSTIPIFAEQPYCRNP